MRQPSGTDLRRTQVGASGQRAIRKFRAQDTGQPVITGAMVGGVPSAAALIDLLGALAYGQLAAFDHLAADARIASTLAGRARMSTMAAEELVHHRLLVARLHELGVEPAAAMSPFIGPVEQYHRLTTPSDWPEAVVKAYVGESIAADFYREMTAMVDAPTRELIEQVLTVSDRAEFAVAELASELAVDDSRRGRLALWSRRLVGEAISQVQHCLAQRDALMDMLIGQSAGGALASVSALISRIVAQHETRMTRLHLAP